MTKLFAFLELARRGSAVTDPALWKNRSALVMALSAFIVAIAQVAKAFGHDIGIDNDTASAIAGGIAAVAGLWSTYATSDKVGLPPKREADPAPPSGGPDVPGNTPF
jgi:hypothetical protein